MLQLLAKNMTYKNFDIKKEYTESKGGDKKKNIKKFHKKDNRDREESRKREEIVNEVDSDWFRNCRYRKEYGHKKKTWKKDKNSGLKRKKDEGEKNKVKKRKRKAKRNPKKEKEKKLKKRKKKKKKKKNKRKKKKKKKNKRKRKKRRKKRKRRKKKKKKKKKEIKNIKLQKR